MRAPALLVVAFLLLIGSPIVLRANASILGLGICWNILPEQSSHFKLPRSVAQLPLCS